jgi:hypothetical protein
MTDVQNINNMLGIELIGRWIEDNWIPKRPEPNLVTIWIDDISINQTVMAKFDRSFDLPDGYHFVAHEVLDSPAAAPIYSATYNGELTYRTGTYLFRFEKDETQVEVLVIAAYHTDHGDLAVLGCMPDDFVKIWRAFEHQCDRVAHPRSRVTVIGGRAGSFEPTVDWDDVVLPDDLKTELFNDVQSFFQKGIEVYKRLKLKPFRKLLLAGVPGTGKTMLCNALAKWALERHFLVIYISSADQSGSTFGKIQHALHIASNANKPTLVLLEELDAYLHEQEKALVLNVLDGSESFDNEYGTLLISTTNYPEAIDERVLKRPGRLDRIYIVPEITDPDSAEQMLKQYLGDMWQDDHATVARQMVGFPGAFIREVAVYALTLVAYDDLPALTHDLLEASYKRLKDQIDTRDDFLAKSRRNGKGVGFHLGES